MVLITAPSIIVAIDDSIDVSIFYGCTEEEEKENENIKTFELLFSEEGNNRFPFSNFSQLKSLVYLFNDYSKPHLNLVSPPPEFT